jgi:hypothetical protein
MIKGFLTSLSQASPPLSEGLASSEYERASLMLASFEMLQRGYRSTGKSIGGITDEDLSRTAGYTKITHATTEAEALGLQWIWSDTCCIDRASSA